MNVTERAKLLDAAELLRREGHGELARMVQNVAMRGSKDGQRGVRDTQRRPAGQKISFSAGQKISFSAAAAKK